MARSRWPRRLGMAAAALGLGLTMALSPASPAAAETNPACPSGVTQIGVTGHITIGGHTFASVKQFKGCGKNWGYIFVWKSWRDSHSGSWEMCIAIAKNRTSPFEQLGTRCAFGRTVELWSEGTNTLTVCTHAIGYWPDVASGRTDIRC
jgi:hypothetical protein